MAKIPLTVLDLSPIVEGSDAATALRSTVDLAQHAEQWGYHRYWVGEHHFVAVASSSPAVLIGQIAAATDRIRVGSGVVQLGFTTPVSVVESFGVLAALHPGRIDLGLGRVALPRRGIAAPTEAGPAVSPQAPRDAGGLIIPAPFDFGALMRDPKVRAQIATRMAILQPRHEDPPDYADQVDDILAMLNDCYRADGEELHVVPGAGAGVTPWIFGSSKGGSAEVAGSRGLPFVASYHITPATTLDAVDAYRRSFMPSPFLSEPHVVVSADVVVADDTATARHLASTYGHWMYSIRTGGAMPYPDPNRAPPLTADQRALVQDRLETQFVGDADEVAGQLTVLQRATGADELVITSVTHRHEDRLRSHELIAKRWGLTG